MLGRGLVSALVIGCVVGAGSIALAPRSTSAQGIVAACSKLWYQRNAIYAQNGFCFKRQKSKMCFPNSCFGPAWGKLTVPQERAVAAIRARERSLGCNYNLVDVGLVGC